MDKRKAFYLPYIGVAIFCVFSSGWVSVNDDLTSYLPDDTETRQGLTIMDEEFVTFGSNRVMVDNITYQRAGELAATLETLEGVKSVDFLILRSDGRVVRTIPFAFGQRLSRIELPAPPEKEGFFGVWPAPEDDTPRSDVILDAEYAPWLTVISSRQAVGDRPLALIDGQFTSQAALDAAVAAAALAVLLLALLARKLEKKRRCTTPTRSRSCPRRPPGSRRGSR